MELFIVADRNNTDKVNEMNSKLYIYIYIINYQHRQKGGKLLKSFQNVLQFFQEVPESIQNVCTVWEMIWKVSSPLPS